MGEMSVPVQKPLDISSPKPFVLLVVGVNGSGKTTTIGKLSRRYADEGKQVLAACEDGVARLDLSVSNARGRRIPTSNRGRWAVGCPPQRSVQ